MSKDKAKLDNHGTGPVIVSKKFKSLTQKRLRRLGFLGIMLILVLAVVLAAHHKKKAIVATVTKQPVVASTTCSTPAMSATLKDAAAAFSPTKITQLQVIVTKIQKLSSYQNDPNCLFVLLEYDINTSNAKDARTTVDSLAKVYNPKQGFSVQFGNRVQSLTTLQVEVTALENAVKQLQTNIKESANHE